MIIIVLSALCTSCAWMSGSNVHEDVLLRVPPSTHVLDVYTGDEVPIDSLVGEGGTQSIITLRNGMRHALRFSHDSGVRYQTFDLRRNWIGALNALSPAGVGFLVDQTLGTAYHLEPQFVRAMVFDTMSAEIQRHIEDSLRSIDRRPIPHSVIDHRTNVVGSFWATIATAGPSHSDLPFSPAQLGVGLAPIPYVMVLFEYSWMGGITYPDLYTANYGSYETSAEFRSWGICLQEPVYGLFASWRYGNGITREYAVETGTAPDRIASITHYSLGVGFYGQWGRFEYRVLRFTSWDANYANADLGLISHGFYYTLQLMF